jgi:hypothetical protein
MPGEQVAARHESGAGLADGHATGADLSARTGWVDAPTCFHSSTKSRDAANVVARPLILGRIPPANQMKFPRTLQLRLFQLNSAGETQTLRKEEISCASVF